VKRQSLAQNEITLLLEQAGAGDKNAIDALMPVVYDELRRLAAHYLRSERQGHTLQPTALVNEAFLRLVGQQTEWQNRNHFFAVAASSMRRILVDYARQHLAEKRGGGEKISLDEAFVFVRERPQEFIAIDEALSELAATDERRARVVELRFFAGLNNEEIAKILGIHSNTVLRDWNLARAWLRTRI
jgi:RNA polymerase sigma factor (TIGR02999 family)